MIAPGRALGGQPSPGVSEHLRGVQAAVMAELAERWPGQVPREYVAMVLTALDDLLLLLQFDGDPDAYRARVRQARDAGHGDSRKQIYLPRAFD